MATPTPEYDMSGVVRMPRFQATTIVTTKFFQAGAVLGTLVGVVSAKESAMDLKPGQTANSMTQCVERMGTRGMVLGAGTGLVLALVGMYAMGDKDLTAGHINLYRNNKRQRHLDRCSVLGLGTGVGISMLLNNPLTLGAAVGTSCGVALGLMTKNVYKKQKVL